MRRSSKKLPKNAGKLAYEIVHISTDEPEEDAKEEEIPTTEKPTPKRSAISEYLSLIGRKGGLKGGKARAAKLTPERRREISQKAAQARWHKE
jgi:hypothetical protein